MAFKTAIGRFSFCAFLRKPLISTVSAESQYAANVSFGGYKLPPILIQRIRGGEPAEAKMDEFQKAKWAEKVGDDTMIRVDRNVVYFGRNPNRPEIGDVRITLTKTMPADISIIARVNGSTFEENVTSNGNRFSRVDMGTVSMAAMFQAAEDENAMLTWILRGVGVLLVVVGLRAMLGLLPMLLKVVPFLSSIADVGITLICVVGGLAWSFLIISIAWLVYRPLIGVPLLVLAILGFVYLRKLAKKKKAAIVSATVNAAVNQVVPPQ